MAAQCHGQAFSLDRFPKPLQIFSMWLEFSEQEYLTRALFPMTSGQGDEGTLAERAATDASQQICIGTALRMRHPSKDTSTTIPPPARSRKNRVGNMTGNREHFRFSMGPLSTG